MSRGARIVLLIGIGSLARAAGGGIGWLLFRRNERENTYIFGIK